MRSKIHSALHSALAVASLLATTAARADDVGPEPSYSLAYNVGVVSDYRVRGLMQTSGKPAVQGGIDLTTKSGLYLGTFLSNVKWIKDFNGATKGSLEVDLYGGYRDAITSDVSFDVGAIRYQYPGNNSGEAGTPGAGLYTSANTTEVYLQLSYKFVNLKYNRGVTDFLGDLDSKGAQYFDLNAGIDLGNGFLLTPHIGHQLVPNQGAGGNQANYTDYSLAIAKDFGNGFVATATAMGTNTKKGAGNYYHDFNGRDIGKSTLVVGVKYNF